MSQAKIVGTGVYLPGKILANADLEKIVDTSDEWIVTRTGMKERRIASEKETTSFMGIEAAKKAMEDAHVTTDQIDLILVATLSADYLFPSTACLVQAGLQAEGVAALDIQAACSGYVYGLSIAKAYVESGMYRRVLLIASEKLSTITDYQDRSTCVLFGDGACAAVIAKEGKGFVIEGVVLGADGKQKDILHMPAGGTMLPASRETVEQRLHFIKMEGKEVYKHAVRRMEAAAEQCLQQIGCREKDISYLVPHQANMRIIESLAKRFEVPMEKVFITIHKYGNTSASACGIAFDELVKEDKLQAGDKVLLVAFGAGLTWGAAIVTKEG
ncbi:MAG: ketoacyl-ACP synthase III [Chlamydiae bacterium]|nr:ketoacyl-ACP synthase III [Chlamydiota bacterium]